MSYDLMFFEITKAPKTKKEFMDWYDSKLNGRKNMIMKLSV